LSVKQEDILTVILILPQLDW